MESCNDIFYIFFSQSLLKVELESLRAQGREKQRMLEVWLSLKRRFQCKPHPKEFHDPKASQHQRNAQRTKSGKLEGSTIKGFIQGIKKHSEKPQSFKPKTKGVIDITNPITHEIFLDSSNSEIKICRCCPCSQSNSSSKSSEGPHRTTRPSTPSSIVHHVDYNEERMSIQMESVDPSILICHKCGEKLKNLVAVEAHHISEHSGND